ncbi:hypothetical protein ED733_006522 [Metarhizium rileyi]|uniref:FAD-dependent oxidoreductase 2 FAD-binding domain-containing protein n=1 Tax=Metarhizium rileyi (strain RCEF 4871) TaxID=1649241 RepID=A0A5C6GGI9_METRR|nr:hypothetical protein ED733_006522 [Metarhizium rileyi]
MSAAISAKQAGAQSVVLIDKCPESWAGGNSYFTAGAYRAVHNGLQDVLPLVNNVSEQQAGRIVLEPYGRNDFAGDLDRVCMGRTDARLAKVLVEESLDAIKFWGGLCLKTEEGGKSLVRDLQRAASQAGVQTLWSTPFRSVKKDAKTGRLNVVVGDASPRLISTGAVIFAAGGFEANPRMRAAHLGPGWDMAMVRGTPNNTGECLEYCLRTCDAVATGDWSGCHSVAWDANADAESGHREISNELTKSGYPLGLMVNAHGRRFVDEGEDMRNYTYAKFGRAILEQPDHMALQVFDAQATAWLRSEEYRPERVERITADSIEELADKCVARGLRSKDAFVQTILEYNEAVLAHRRENPSAKWDPSTKDGLSTQSTMKRLGLAKSNWALALDRAPFLAVKVTAGITFTFGGLKVDPDTAQILPVSGVSPSRALYCVGEMMGGLFYENYPGGSGLTAGTVFGRRAGKAAAEFVEGLNKVLKVAGRREGTAERKTREVMK